MVLLLKMSVVFVMVAVLLMVHGSDGSLPAEGFDCDGNCVIDSDCNGDCGLCSRGFMWCMWW